MTDKLIIATRGSPLALWQAEHVRDKLLRCHPGLDVRLKAMHTQGDRMRDARLSESGGKGLFVKELEQALYDHRADLAVHSMKDVTVDIPDGLSLPVVLRRGNPYDAFVATAVDSLTALPPGAVVGTSSPRRRCQLKSWRADLCVKELRGNVGTRLKKLDNKEYDAIILAAAGLSRLGLSRRVKQIIPTEIMLPAVGQGAIGLQTRAGDRRVLERVRSLDDEATQRQVEAERAVNKHLFGGCQLPIAAHARCDGDAMELRGMVGRIDGSKVVRAVVNGHANEGAALGLQLAELLLNDGAAEILRESRRQ